jgi:tRNA G10  N-methylase Trm11
MQILYILGRQSDIGIAELESLYGAACVAKISNHALVETDQPVPFSHIGGSVKAATVVKRLSTTQPAVLERELSKIIAEHLPTLPSEGKIKLGVSSYGLGINAQKMNSLGIQLKKYIRNAGRSVRHIPNTEAELSSAQAYHNKLAEALGIELVLLRDVSQTLVALTTDVQDINSYTMRDRSRPKRDARVGMLPPKLAQIIINLSAGKSYGQESRTTHPTIVLDPFCGTGVVLQEALLMGYHVIGTDLDPRMVEYTQKNLAWLSEKMPEHGGFTRYIEQGDATDKKWFESENIDTIACETYLGRPFTNEPDREILLKNRTDCDTIIRKFLENVHTQLQSGTRLCIGVPAWFAHGTIYHLKTLDYLEEIGYNRMSFVHADAKNMIYHREGQVVGRELVVITRK